MNVNEYSSCICLGILRKPRKLGIAGTRTASSRYRCFVHSSTTCYSIGYYVSGSTLQANGGTEPSNTKITTHPLKITIHNHLIRGITAPKHVINIVSLNSSRTKQPSNQEFPGYETRHASVLACSKFLA